MCSSLFGVKLYNKSGMLFYNIYEQIAIEMDRIIAQSQKYHKASLCTQTIYLLPVFWILLSAVPCGTPKFTKIQFDIPFIFDFNDEI